MPREVKWAISLAVGAGLLFLGWRVYFVLVTLHVVICGLLIIVIMLQSGEAADLAGAFGGAGSQTAFGPRGAATFLSKATTWCAIMFMLTSMAMTMHQNTVVHPPGVPCFSNFRRRRRLRPRRFLSLPWRRLRPLQRLLRRRRNKVFRIALGGCFPAAVKSFLHHLSRKWRNWRTHDLEGVAP